MTRLRFILGKFLGNITARPLAALGSVLSLFLLFLLFDLVWIASYSINGFYNKIISEIEIEVFLDNTVPDSTMTIIGEIIGDLEGIDSIEYISRDNARSKLNDLMGVDLLEGFENNPLPRSIIIIFEPNYLNSQNLDALNQALKRMAGVSDIFYPSNWLARAEYTKLVISEILILLGIVISIAVLLNIIQIIVLSARTRTEEIVQLQLMGAGSGFLATPYIIEGIFYALAASVIGWILIYYAIDLYTFRNIEIILPSLEERSYFCMATFLIGMIGGYLGIRREL